MTKAVFSKQKGTPPKPGHGKKKSKPNKQPQKESGHTPQPIKQTRPFIRAASINSDEGLRAGRLRSIRMKVFEPGGFDQFG